MAEPTHAEKEEQWTSIAEQIFAGFLNAWIKSDVSKAAVTGAADIIGGVLGTAVTLMAPVGIGLAKGIAKSEDVVAPALSEMAAAAVNDIFGVNVPASAFDSGMGGKSRTGAAAALGDGLIDVLKGGGDSLQPSDVAAKRYLTFVVNMALEGWYQKWFFEFLSSLIPQLDVGKIENFGSLDDKMAQAIGLGRLTRRVLSPILDTTIVEPLRWQVDKVYRPRLLAAGEVARQVARGRMTREAGFEELARQGYSDERIEALFNAVAKFHSVTDVDLLMRSELWTRAQGIQHLRDQGYEESVAVNELALERLKRIVAFERRMADDAIDAFVDGRIDRGRLDRFLSGVTIDAQERAQMAEVAEARRALRERPLSSSEARALAKDLILSVSDYRRALERENRTPEAIAALELSLRADMDRARQVEEHRAIQAAERKAEEEARAAERARRRAEVEAERARARRGREADLERAVIRGRIPIERYAEILAGQFDADTIAIMLHLVEADRLAYLESQARRQAAAQRAERRPLDLGAVERAVLARVLTVADYRRRLEAAGLDGADVEILAVTLEARVRDRDAREARRADLEPPAAERQLSLPQFEALVLRGIRTLEDYAGALAAAGFGVADVDALAELLEARLEERRQAIATRAAAEGTARTRGLSVDQFRRAVLRGVRTLDEYALFLQDQRFTADAQATLVADLERELAEVEAARRRRAEAEAGMGAPALPLSVVERAARLGVLSIEEYRARLADLKLSELDQAVLVDVLLAELSTMQEQRARRETIAGELAARGISLSQFERAVKRGVKNLEEYRAFLAGQRYGSEDVLTLVSVLAAELGQTKDGQARRGAIAARLAAAGLDLEALEREILTGVRSIDSYVSTLAGAGVAAADVGLLVGLLVDALEGAAAAGAAGG